MKPLFSAAEMRAADAYTTEELHVLPLALMERAAKHVAEAVQKAFPDKKAKGLILAGGGNNGGDALAVARLLCEAGYAAIEIHLYASHLTPETTAQKQKLQGLEVEWVDKPKWDSCAWVVDGLFGTGLSRPLDDTLLHFLAPLTSEHKAKVFSIDVPSGLDADTGQPLGGAIRADVTIVIGQWKQGLFTGAAADYVGELRLVDIGIPDSFPNHTPSAYLFDAEEAKRLLPVRRPTGHKGTFGHLYVWGGTEQTEGAAALACVAGFRTGTGVITLISDRNLDGLRRRLPMEVMSKEVGTDFLSEAKAGSAFVLGPGMGTTSDRRPFIESALSNSAPLVLDADALTVLADHKDLIPLCARDHLILTPHPKEASRLLGKSVEAIEADRFAACEKLVQRFGATILLKGKGTLIGAPTFPIVAVSQGNTALSKGGTGDILSGILGGLLAQGVQAFDAACLGAFIHGRAAEILAKRMGTERSAMASEIADCIPAVWSELEK